MSPGLPRGPFKIYQHHSLDPRVRTQERQREGMGSSVLGWTRQRACLTPCGNLRGLSPSPSPAHVACWLL